MKNPANNGSPPRAPCPARNFLDRGLVRVRCWGRPISMGRWWAGAVRDHDPADEGTFLSGHGRTVGGASRRVLHSQCTTTSGPTLFLPFRQKHAWFMAEFGFRVKAFKKHVTILIYAWVTCHETKVAVIARVDVQNIFVWSTVTSE
jgi:hypothetical protein